MNINSTTKHSRLNNCPKACHFNKKEEMSKTLHLSSENIGLNALANYAHYNVFKGYRTKLNVAGLKQLNIPNLRFIDNNCIRGESLSSKKNRKFLTPVSKYGIKSIIDLRDKYTSLNFGDMCANASLNYYHIPIDANSVDNRKIINQLPLLFKILDEGNTYIACAQGLHRTDIALAINYVFNPELQETPPVMHGHFRDKQFKFEDIFQRLNLIKKEANLEDIRAFGWTSYEDFDKAFSERKNKIKEFNTNIAKELFNS